MDGWMFVAICTGTRQLNLESSFSCCIIIQEVEGAASHPVPPPSETILSRPSKPRLCFYKIKSQNQKETNTLCTQVFTLPTLMSAVIVSVPPPPPLVAELRGCR